MKVGLAGLPFSLSRLPHLALRLHSLMTFLMCVASGCVSSLITIFRLTERTPAV